MLDNLLSHTVPVMLVGGVMMLGVALSVYRGWRKEQERRGRWR